MKYFYLFLLTLGSLLLCFSCSDDVNNVGANIRPTEDAIVIHADTFHLQTENILVDHIYSRPDSFLLGTFYDDKYGMTRGEILSQIACPEGYDFPEGAVGDSVLVYIYYKTWFGDGNSPMQINIYEINKKRLDYTTHYASNLSVDEFCDKSTLLGSRIIAAATPTDSVYSSSTYTYSPYIAFNFGTDFAQRFMPTDNNIYASQLNFTDFFKGMYITAEFGTACMLHITQIDLGFYYHFTYQKNGSDTTVVGSKVYPANSEVRQINLFSHTDRETVVQNVDSINYIASPANIFTRVTLPTGRMYDKIRNQVGDKRVYPNSTALQIEIVDYNTDSWTQPWNYLMLIKESALDRFFTTNELPSDTCAILGSISSVKVDDSKYNYYYSYDLSDILMLELQKERADVNEELNMVLVPVSVETSTSSSSSSSVTVNAVDHEYLMGGATIRSGKNTTSPMRITILYSGF